jgi:hypothetical protein
MASLLQNWDDISSAPVDKVLPALLAYGLVDIRERLAAAPPAWRVALDIIDVERVSPATCNGSHAIHVHIGFALYRSSCVNLLHHPCTTDAAHRLDWLDALSVSTPTICYGFPPTRCTLHNHVHKDWCTCVPVTAICPCSVPCLAGSVVARHVSPAAVS